MKEKRYQINHPNSVLSTVFQLVKVKVRRSIDTRITHVRCGGNEPHRVHPPPPCMQASPRPNGCRGQAQDFSATNGILHTSLVSIYIVYKTYTKYRYYINTQHVCEFGVWSYSYATVGER
jgi:hypothetical protein